MYKYTITLENGTKVIIHAQTPREAQIKAESLYSQQVVYMVCNTRGHI